MTIQKLIDMTDCVQNLFLNRHVSDQYEPVIIFNIAFQLFLLSFYLLGPTVIGYTVSQKCVTFILSEPVKFGRKTKLPYQHLFFSNFQPRLTVNINELIIITQNTLRKK